jgi:acetyl esterase/lipase
MSRTIFFITAFLCQLYFQLQAQQGNTSYARLENIRYRTESPTDPYESERCVLDLYYPEEVSGFKTVVWFHGGGLTSGEKSVPERLKDQKIAVAAVNYRLHPYVHNPVYIEDASAAVAWVFRNIESYGGNPTEIYVAGHSAGGYLAMMVSLDKKWLENYGTDADRIAAVVPFSGHTITHMTVRKELGIPDTQPMADEYSPLWHVRPNAPPLHLITGDRDLEMLGRYEENAYLWRMMKVAGHTQTFLYELDGFDHGNMADPAFDLLLKIIR